MRLPKIIFRVPEKLIELFVDVWNKHNSHKHLDKDWINSGWCYQFAPVIKEVFGARAKLMTNTNHAWVKVGNRHYDSDFPEGVPLKELRWGNSSEPVVIKSVAELKKWWIRESGSSGPLREDIVSEVVERYKSNKY